MDDVVAGTKRILFIIFYDDDERGRTNWVEKTQVSAARCVENCGICRDWVLLFFRTIKGDGHQLAPVPRRIF
jgi:hypothetical protein